MQVRHGAGGATFMALAVSTNTMTWNRGYPLRERAELKNKSVDALAYRATNI